MRSDCEFTSWIILTHGDDHRNVSLIFTQSWGCPSQTYQLYAGVRYLCHGGQLSNCSYYHDIGIWPFYLPFISGIFANLHGCQCQVPSPILESVSPSEMSSFRVCACSCNQFEAPLLSVNYHQPICHLPLWNCLAYNSSIRDQPYGRFRGICPWIMWFCYQMLNYRSQVCEWTY